MSPGDKDSRECRDILVGSGLKGGLSERVGAGVGEVIGAKLQAGYRTGVGAGVLALARGSSMS